MQKHPLLVFFFILLDGFSALLSWWLFYYARKTSIEQMPYITSDSLYWGIAIVPIIWLLLYYLQGTYHDIKRLYRFKLVNLTFIGTIIGSIALFFLLLLDDEISGYQVYYKSILLLFGIHFLVTLLPRLIFVTVLVKRIQSGRNGFSTVLIGGSDKAVEIYKEINQLPKNIYRFMGFININGVDRQLENDLPYLGHIDDLERILQDNNVEEAIIALESTEHDKLKSIVSRLEGGDLSIKILPDMYDILSGSVKMTNISSVLFVI